MHLRAEAGISSRRERPEERLRVLMVRGLDGDSDAYQQLFIELTRYLRGYFSRRIAGVEVEDLVQEALLAAHLKRHTYDPTRPFTPWVYAIAQYKLADHFRRKHSAHVSLDGAEDLVAPDSADEGTLRADIDRLLTRLPVRQRSLLVDVKLRGCSVMEAARKHGLSAVSVRVMLHRSLKWLVQTARVENR